MIFKTLKKDHDEIRSLLKNLTRNNVPTPKDFQKLRNLLSAHAKAEEDVVYKILIQMECCSDSVREGIEEHRLGNLLLTELNSFDMSSPDWKAKLKALKDVTEHHLKEEEEELFAEAEKDLSREKCEELNLSFLDMKSALMVQMKEEGSIESELIAVPPHHAIDAHVTG